MACQAVATFHPPTGRQGTVRDRKGTPVGLAILLLILALLLGGVGLFVEALRWVLIIALVLLIVGAVTGARGRRV